MGTRRRTAAIQDRTCTSVFVHYYLFIFLLSAQAVASHILSLLSPVVGVNLQDRVPPLDLAFTWQTVPNTLFKWSIFIILHTYGVGSNANAPRVPRRGLLLLRSNWLHFSKLLTCTFVHALLVQVLHRCCRVRWVFGSKRLEITQCSHPSLGKASARKRCSRRRGPRRLASLA